MKKDTIENMRKIANERSGKCLSEKYTNAHTKLLWECSKGHQWWATPDKIKQGRWCRVCVGTEKHTIEKMQLLVKARGGKCLSERYKNVGSKLKWQCSVGHIWKAIPSSVIKGHWCPVCASKERAVKSRLSIEVIRKTVEERGGKCLSLSGDYKNNLSPLIFECANGHKWKNTYSSIQQGSWCPECIKIKLREKLRLNIEVWHKIAEERGGKCLSSEYKNNATPMLWKCANGHKWKARYANIRNGRWCPECSYGLGERICRAFFEQLFNKPFPKAFPKWLENERKGQMELDGYCEELKLAFEHQGRQHYHMDNPFINSHSEFTLRQKDDERKRELCKEYGVVLLEIPEIPVMLKITDVKEFIKKESLKSGIKIPSVFETKQVSFKEAYAPDNLKYFRQIAESRGGKLISNSFLGWKTRLEWQCKEGHLWEALPFNVKKGHWCQKCANKNINYNQRLSIKDMQVIAKKRSGKCLSKQYKNVESKLLWECSEGHQWLAKPTNIKTSHVSCTFRTPFASFYVSGFCQPLMAL